MENNNLGWISSNEPELLSREINKSFLDKEKRAYIRANAPEIIRRDFDVDFLVKQYVKMYNKQ